MIERITRSGSTCGSSSSPADGEPLLVQLTRDRLERARARAGPDRLGARRAASATFAAPAPAASAERRVRRARPPEPRDEIGERRLLEHAAHRRAQLDPDVAQRHAPAPRTRPRRAHAAHARDRALDGADHVGDADLGRPGARARSRPRRRAGSRRARRAGGRARMFSRNFSGISCAGREPLALDRARAAAASSSIARSA